MCCVDRKVPELNANINTLETCSDGDEETEKADEVFIVNGSRHSQFTKRKMMVLYLQIKPLCEDFI